MNRKIFFWCYTLLVWLSIFGVKQMMLPMPVKIFAAIFFSYQSEPFLIAAVCVLALLFEYVSIVIPREELISSALFVSIRQPSSKILAASYFRFLLPYIVPFALFKGYALWLHFSLISVLWFLGSLTVWLLLVFSLPRKQNATVINILIFIAVMFLRLWGFMIIS